MADASCSGPSPFKRLVEHQNRDVSHHQDRLVNGAAGNQHGSFRSQPVHPAQAQNGFGAFMNDTAQLPGAPHHPAGRLAAHAAALDPLHHQAHNPQLQQARISPGPQVNDWAADFNRFASQQPQPHQAPALQQHAPAAAAPQFQQDRMAAAFGFQGNMNPNVGFAPLYGPTNSGFMDPNVASAQRPAAESDFDDEMSRWMATHGGAAANSKAMEDVDAVMDQMARELELNDHALDEAKQDNVEPTIEETNHLTDLGGAEIGNLSRPENPIEEHAEPKGRSEVSEAAERLLETVQHEDGEKWKNSAFLSLMRDFRDGRKDIVDNEIRETPDEGGSKEPAAS